MRARSLLLLGVVMLLVVSCASGSSNPRQQVQAVAHRYLVAVARGNGRIACALLSRRGLNDGGYSTQAACAHDYSSRPLKQVFAILKITITHQTAAVVIGDARVSDSGNDTIELRRYDQRWLIDVG